MKVIPFYGTCSARSELVMSSPNIGYPFEIVHIRAKFALGCENLVQVKLFLAEDTDEPSSGEPDGVNILQDTGYVTYLVGDNEVKDLDHNVSQHTGNTTVKVYANNTDFSDHAVDVLVTIKPLTKGDE